MIIGWPSYVPDRRAGRSRTTAGVLRRHYTTLLKGKESLSRLVSFRGVGDIGHQRRACQNYCLSALGDPRPMWLSGRQLWRIEMVDPLITPIAMGALTGVVKGLFTRLATGRGNAVQL